MKTRAEAARYAEALLDDKIVPLNKSAWHFGKMELRMLMDYIYESLPQTIEEHLDYRDLRNNTGAKNKRWDTA